MYVGIWMVADFHIGQRLNLLVHLLKRVGDQELDPCINVLKEIFPSAGKVGLIPD